MQYGFLLLAFVFIGCASRPKPLENELDPAVVKQVLDEHAVPIRHCYEKEVKYRTLIKGSSILQWEVTPAGRVDNVVVVGSFDQFVENCLVSALKEFRFPIGPDQRVRRARHQFRFDIEK